MAMNSLRQRSTEPKSRVQGRREVLARRTLLTQAIEEQLVQDHRIGGDQLLALEAVDEEVGRRIEVEAGELLGDEVQALHRAAVVVFVVADDQLLGHALDVLGIAAERFHCKGHRQNSDCERHVTRSLPQGRVPFPPRSRRPAWGSSRP